jgi:putative SOS response-associated peptidase YedK
MRIGKFNQLNETAKISIKCYTLRTCGSFYLTVTAGEIKRKFDVGDVLELEPRYNIAPTQRIPIVIAVGKKSGALSVGSLWTKPAGTSS